MEETTSILSSDLQIIQGSNSGQQSYDWLGVLKFLQEQYKESIFKHTEHLLEKQQQQEKIHVLESDLKAQETINRELIQRVKMLEFSLRQERIRYAKLLQSNNISPEIIKQLQQSENLATVNGAPNLPQISQRKTKQHRPALLKLLEEVGLSDIFDDEADHPEKENPSNNNDRTVIVGGDEISNSKISQQAQFQQQQINQQQSTLLKEGNIRNPESNNGTNNTKSIISNNATPQQVQSQPLTLQAELRNHLDGVRDAFFAKDSTLVTVSEDYTVKLWDTKEFTQESKQTNISPFLTLREHSGQITTIAGIRAELAEVDNARQLFLTAGFEGVVKVWGVYNKDEVDTFGPREGKHGSLGGWLASDEPIWQLSAHPYENEILSASADGKVSLWQLQSSLSEDTNEEDQTEDLNMDKFSALLTQTYTNPERTDRPSSCTFLPSTLHLVAAAFTLSNSILIFDKETGRVVNSLRDASSLSGLLADQIYKCVPHPQLRLILSAHENSKIRIFDINSSKPIQQLEAHADAVTSMAFHANRNYLTSVGHDGAVKTWDIRQYKCLGAQQAHNSKFDEAIHNVAYNAATNSLATCGADGIVNVYSSNV